jgi:hypothetical protein
VTDENGGDEERDPIFESRERAILSVSSTVSLVVGLWAGHWLVPAEAFARHITYNATYSDGLRAHYMPTNRILPLLSLLILGIGAWYAYRSLRDTTEGGEEP